MGQIEVFSPAKINLFLSVLGKMENGFHELVSLVAPVDFGDTVRVSSGEGPRGVTLECDDLSLPTGSGNLAFAAAERFLEAYGLERSVKIKLTKRIPHGAGLGGGSSNASAVLEALARLEGIERDERLEGVAAELGSDCPLFLRGAPVVMRGRGELLSDVSDEACDGLKGRRVLLFRPGFSIGTAWAYGKLASTDGAYSDRDWSEKRLCDWAAGELELGELLFNSFEAPVFRKFPAMPIVVERLKEMGMASLMSGSGSCCFLLCESDEQELAARLLIEEFWGNLAFVESAKLL